ncbi:MAG: HD domain-containing phosphohydrolase [Planctomycetota bacterium]|nr:HD domain-containing phosphohydrolase [Planctomycetota bacterium]
MSASPKTRRFALRSRRRLIAATVLLQGVVIGAGWLASLHATRAGLTSKVRERTIEDAGRRAAAFAAQLERGVDGPVRHGNEAWQRAQEMVRASQPPGGTLLVLDRYGSLLCHPALEANPGLRRVDYREQRVTLVPGGEQMELGQLRPHVPLSGEVEFLGGRALVGVVYTDAAQAKVVVLMPADAAGAAAASLSSEVLLWTAVAGAGALVLTVLGSALLVRRYDSILMRANRSLEEELERRVRRGLDIRNGLIFGLAKLADYRDTDTGSHLDRICRYSETLARALRDEFSEITRGWIDLLRLAASMHDIGKVGIADSILLKPGALTPEERRLMELHPLIGADTLVAIRKRVGQDDLLDMGIQITLSHHERWDGTGYPYRLEGEQIPLAARVVALADVYDALTSKRVYKPAMPHAKARDVIVASRGTHLDPRVVDAFDRIHAEFDRIRAEMAPRGGEAERPSLVTAVELAEAARGRLAA